MFCRHCGTNIPDDARFCTSCGAPTTAEEPNCTQGVGNNENTNYSNDFGYQNNNFGYENNPYSGAYQVNPDDFISESKDAEAQSILSLGIAGLACAASGCAAPVGIVLSAVALGKRKKYDVMVGRRSAKANVGKGLAIGGLALGIFMTAYLFILFVALSSV